MSSWMMSILERASAHYVRIADHGQLVVLLGLATLGPVGRARHDVDAVDNDHLQVHDGRLLAMADCNTVARFVVHPRCQEFVLRLPAGLRGVQTHLHIDRFVAQFGSKDRVQLLVVVAVHGHNDAFVR
jgi:hypothetical protein